MANYAETADIAARIGFTPSASTRPTATLVATMQNIATAYINTVIKASSNVTDTYKTCKVMEIELVWRMVNNIFYLAEPDLYQYIPVELNEFEIRLLRLATSAFYAESWELGE